MPVLQPLLELGCLSQMQTNKENWTDWLDVWAKLLYGLMAAGGGGGLLVQRKVMRTTPNALAPPPLHPALRPKGTFSQRL